MPASSCRLLFISGGKQQLMEEVSVKSKNLIVSELSCNPLKSQQSNINNRWCSLVVFLMATVLSSTTLAKNPGSSRDLIKIIRAPEINQAIKASEATEPVQAALRKKILITADTFLQYYMNGHLSQMEIPDDWKKKNGSFMGMSMGDWEKLVNRQTDKSFSEWKLCPTARMMSITKAMSTTVIRYEFVTVGRFTMQNEFSKIEKGNPFLIDVLMNDQAKVIDRKMTPSGANASPYIRVDEPSSICKLTSKEK